MNLDWIYLREPEKMNVRSQPWTCKEVKQQQGKIATQEIKKKNVAQCPTLYERNE